MSFLSAESEHPADELPAFGQRWYSLASLQPGLDKRVGTDAQRRISGMSADSIPSTDESLFYYPQYSAGAGVLRGGGLRCDRARENSFSSIPSTDESLFYTHYTGRAIVPDPGSTDSSGRSPSSPGSSPKVVG